MTCPLYHTTGCRWCGKPLTGRQKIWCSRSCVRANTANHRWTQAKAKAKAEVTWYRCKNSHDSTTDGILFYAKGGCLGFTQEPEVNHIVPCKGKHGVWGCHHHQDNLEVLCKPCHQAETKRQRKNGEFK